ncbi:hypothetical protein EW146_g7264 [Bondarzewia mesenterica]|uniref:F-box domain-containing protein n=1 Tax=Bondarzewia mesenterica TaxID=1095465 RepID=A0A4S4LN38_9AGAM|nr:hypothetical protein EW146_g7264 [Bondarzewia mesenterica]
MDRFPEEIWHLIFELACSEDGGAAGCALSLVSKDVYRVSYPVQLHSVTLTTSKELVAFTLMLSSNQMRLCNLCVRYLSVTAHACGNDRPTRDSTLRDIFRRLLVIVGQSLHTLRVYTIQKPRFSNIIELHELPRLRELYIETDKIEFEITDFLPSLRHLRISHFMNIFQMGRILSSPTLFPELRWVECLVQDHSHKNIKDLAGILGFSLADLDGQADHAIARQIPAANKIQKITYQWQGYHPHTAEDLIQLDLCRIRKLQELAGGRFEMVDRSGPETRPRVLRSVRSCWPDDSI